MLVAFAPFVAPVSQARLLLRHGCRSGSLPSLASNALPAELPKVRSSIIYCDFMLFEALVRFLALSYLTNDGGSSRLFWLFALTRLWLCFAGAGVLKVGLCITIMRCFC